MAAACGSLQHIVEKPLHENPSFIESISSSWNQSKSLKPIDDSSFTEIFGELHFKENNSVTLSSSSSSSLSVGSSSSSFSSCLPLSSESSSFSSTSSSFFLDAIHQSEIEGLDNNNKDKYERNNKSPVSSYSQITNNISNKNNKQDKHSDSLSSRTSDSLSMCTEGLGFESSDDEFLHACREDGRLMMHVIQSDDEIVDEDEDEDEDEDDDGDNDDENNVEGGHDNKHDAKHV
ncbi:putative uncharacterized protein YGR160W [Solanum dulcamara]|uniref:putative uncharacterized protein YGR160W n=1 Tax=Solanum dulcamara TaxID=45834 RepID=UPI002485F734|nr:putative uncharacterized protein YGR160W [Solanum dulcamara]